MILSYLSQAQLQEAVGTKILERLESLAPIVLGDEADPTHLYKKQTLLRVLSAFGPSEKMRDKGFMRDLLNALPSQVLNNLAEATGVGATLVDFDKKRDALVRRGWTDLEFCRSFADAAGLPETFLPVAHAPLPSEEHVTPLARPFKRLKDYQQGVHWAALHALAPPRSRFVVQMPTGSGKTRTAMEIIADVLNGETLAAPSGPRTVVWVAHAEELCEQAIQCFKEVWAHLGSSPCRLVRFFGPHGQPPPSYDGPTLLVMGFQKLHRLVQKDPKQIADLAKATNLLVIDEAHKVLAPTYQEAACALIGNETRVMGLTATPGRSADNDNENLELADFFFNNVVPLEAPEGESVISYLRKAGVLARARMDCLEVEPNLTLTAAQIAKIEQELDYPPGILEKLAADDFRNIEIVTKLKPLCEEGRRILFFACSVEHSQFICALLVLMGFKAAHVDGGTPEAERQAAIAGFRSGEVQVLCNYGILSTGFDAPKTDVVFIARPTKSIVLFSQMVGRGLRGPAIGGKPECLLVNVVDNIVGLPANEDIYDYFEEYWNPDA